MDPVDQLADAIVGAYLAEAFRASLDGDALDDLLIHALLQAAADPDYMAPVSGRQSRQRVGADLEAQYRALRARTEARYGPPEELFGRMQGRGPGMQGRVWC